MDNSKDTYKGIREIDLIGILFYILKVPLLRFTVRVICNDVTDNPWRRSVGVSSIKFSMAFSTKTNC